MLARALALEPRVLLLDEPTSALDEEARGAVEATLLHLRERVKVSTVLVTHDLDQARRMADWVVAAGRGAAGGPGPGQGAAGGLSGHVTRDHSVRLRAWSTNICSCIEAPARSPVGGPQDLPLERLEHEICELAAHLTERMARWLALVGEFDRRDGWATCVGMPVDRGLDRLAVRDLAARRARARPRRARACQTSR